VEPGSISGNSIGYNTFSCKLVSNKPEDAEHKYKELPRKIRLLNGPPWHKHQPHKTGKFPMNGDDIKN